MKTLRIFRMVVLTILVSIGFTSCSKDDKEDLADDFSIIGTWQGSYYFNRDNTTIVYDFKPDGNYTRERFSSINPTKKTYGKYSYANETLILNEWSDKEGYATFEQKIKVISSTEWQTIQTDAEIEMGFPAITFKKI